jgi:hypothetical protein
MRPVATGTTPPRTCTEDATPPEAVTNAALEGRLGQVELVGDRLQGLGVELVRAEHHRQRVAGVRAVGEDVDHLVLEVDGFDGRSEGHR